MANFTGQLNSNEIFSALYNMIISQEVFADNVYDTKASLVDMSRVDGGLYGDTKLFYATDVLESTEWGNDAEAENLLALHRPPAPDCQAITLDNFRQISLTVDDYLSKRAWSTPDAFNSFNSIMLGWIRDTKRVYDSTTFNSYIGTAESTAGLQEITITLPTVADNPEAQARIQAQTIAKTMSDLMVNLEDVSRDYNDYANLRSYNSDDLIAVWRSGAVNSITKLDLPTIFHKDNMIDKFGEYTLPDRYFGRVNTSSGTTGASNTTVRSLVEKDFGAKHCFPGDLLPSSQAYGANETYTVDDTILFKIMHKRSVPYMSAFEVGTSFFNSKSLTTNHYLTWGYNTLQYLQNYPFITVRSSTAI